MMKRGAWPERALTIAVLAVGASACSVKAPGDAKYAAEQCRRVALIDQASAAAIRGAEDLALDPVRDRLFVSAYDRRAVERAAGKRAFDIPQGGVYAVSFSALTGAEDEVNAAPVVAAEDIAGGLRPHGIFVDQHTGDITFINRAYQRIDNRWRMTPRIERVDVDGKVLAGDGKDAPCAANDLLDEKGGALVSFDHQACGWRAGLEEVGGLKRSGIANADGQALVGGVSYANGLVRTREGDVVLAATRERALLVMNEDGNGFTVRERIDVPGGPDNLTLSPDGGIVAAVHPSMLRIGLHRRLGLGAAPSRIVKVDPGDGAVDVLFDDESGRIFSAASVGVEHGDTLILGSPTDEGLLVCKAAG